jgi:methylated-DNA-[protein]-cysteine S-methyltransferase
MRTAVQPAPGHEAIIAAPGFALGVRCAAGRLVEIEFLPAGRQPVAPADLLTRAACAQIERYLEDPDAPFDLPLAPAGSTFQRRVWAAIRAIPRGHRATYGELARQLGSAARAVGQACGANPYPIVVPCHRVVGAGELGGFAHARDGFLLDTKRWLLRHEGAI